MKIYKACYRGDEVEVKEQDVAQAAEDCFQDMAGRRYYRGRGDQDASAWFATDSDAIRDLERANKRLLKQIMYEVSAIQERLDAIQEHKAKARLTKKGDTA